ncbi:MAG: Hsp33 family molecular chaperone HslO [Deltaproteobacteria bacterium]|jgi:molecular chaperone Hsp33|nr:Hsp33 family molecular chaperone HslO [Deltaproteobacteria bacterium]
MKKKALYNDPKAYLKAKARNRRWSFTLKNNQIRGALVNGTLLVKEMRKNFELGILETYALGQAYLAVALLGANLQGNDYLTLEMNSSGAFKGFYAQTNSRGEINGYLKSFQIDQKIKSLSLAPFIQGGTISITKYLEDAKTPYKGNVAIKFKNIAEDLSLYFLQSEQTPTTFIFSIKFDKKGEISGAGGLFLQVFPGTPSEILDETDKIITSLPSLGDYFAGKKMGDDYIKEYFQNLEPKILDKHRVEFWCRCNSQRIADYLKLLQTNELQKIAAEGPFPLEIKCNKCNSPYYFDKKEILQIIADKKKEKK